MVILIFPPFSADGHPPNDAGLGEGDRDRRGQVRRPQSRQGFSPTGYKLLRFILQCNLVKHNYLVAEQKMKVFLYLKSYKFIKMIHVCYSIII